MKLCTERLTLRPFAETDLDTLHAWHADPAVTRYLLNDVESRAETAARLERRIGQTERPTQDGQAVSFAVQLGDQLIGDVMLALVSAEHRCAEIGYVFGPEHGNRGYATETARELIRLGFADMRLHRIIGRCDARHAASEAVLHRVGMRREAVFVENELVKGEWTSEAVWAILERDWHDH